MSRTTMERIVDARLRILENEVPDTVRDHEIITDDGLDRGVITVHDLEGHVLYVEFVESEDSLTRLGALEQFNEATASSCKALVIVPDEARSAAAELLSRGGNPSIELVSYGVVGIYLLI
jgi:hypothetical protein